MLVLNSGLCSNPPKQNKIFSHLLNIKLEAKPASTGQFVSRLQSFESVREFFTSATIAAIVDLPFVLIFILVKVNNVYYELIHYKSLLYVFKTIIFLLLLQ